MPGLQWNRIPDSKAARETGPPNLSGAVREMRRQGMGRGRQLRRPPELTFNCTYRSDTNSRASPSASERKARGLGFPSTFAYTGSKKEILVCRGPVHKLCEPFCFFLL
jgi:hypothetical protein